MTTLEGDCVNIPRVFSTRVALYCTRRMTAMPPCLCAPEERYFMVMRNSSRIDHSLFSNYKCPATRPLGLDHWVSIR